MGKEHSDLFEKYAPWYKIWVRVYSCLAIEDSLIFQNCTIYIPASIVVL